MLSLKKKKTGKWTEKQRRLFFDNLARSKNFDPLNVEKWYSVSVKDVLKAVFLFFNAFNFCFILVEKKRSCLFVLGLGFKKKRKTSFNEKQITQKQRI